MLDKVIVSGFGGQGVLMIGQLICYAGMDAGKNASFFPSYGPEMRGSTANCNATVSDGEIGSPILVDCTTLIAMNSASVAKYESYILPGGTALVNSSIAEEKIQRTDVTAYYIPCTKIAIDENNERGANMVMLGAYIAATGTVTEEAVCRFIDKTFSGRKAQFAEMNKKLVRLGIAYYNENYSKN